jgi:hypothetical protein
LRFRLREALRPLELPRLLSLGARVSESLSTRLDSVCAPDLLCVDEERLDPDDRPRELALERLFDEEERPLDFDEEPLEPPERLLLLDEDLRWGILPLFLLNRSSIRVGRLPDPSRSNTRLGAAIKFHLLARQFKFHRSG